jgi:endogenous inhibitor of DNA gyrase (YacG/DUF329 family)
VTAPRPPDRCPHCDAEVAHGHEVRVGSRPALERATCPHCGLQLVRRPDEPWHGIRG